MVYRDVRLSKDDILQGAYKRYLGGGSTNWEARGAFQLFFLRAMGLRSEHTLLDVGCGPLRAGVHFIKYLAPSGYSGIDVNQDFITAAKCLVSADSELLEKSPTLRVESDFKTGLAHKRYDYILAFSVLQHCQAEECRNFFLCVHNALKETGRLYVTHAPWFNVSLLAGTPLFVNSILSETSDISRDLDLGNWGFPSLKDIKQRPAFTMFPIVELRRR